MIRSFVDYVVQFDQGILQRGEETDLDVAESAWNACESFYKSEITLWENTLKEAEKRLEAYKNLSADLENKLKISIKEIKELEAELDRYGVGVRK